MVRVRVRSDGVDEVEWRRCVVRVRVREPEVGDAERELDADVEGDRESCLGRDRNEYFVVGAAAAAAAIGLVDTSSSSSSSSGSAESRVLRGRGGGGPERVLPLGNGDGDGDGEAPGERGGWDESSVCVLRRLLRVAGLAASSAASMAGTGFFRSGLRDMDDAMVFLLHAWAGKAGQHGQRARDDVNASCFPVPSRGGKKKKIMWAMLLGTPRRGVWGQTHSCHFAYPVAEFWCLDGVLAGHAVCISTHTLLSILYIIVVVLIC